MTTMYTGAMKTPDTWLNK